MLRKKLIFKTKTGAVNLEPIVEWYTMSPIGNFVHIFNWLARLGTLSICSYSFTPLYTYTLFLLEIWPKLKNKLRTNRIGNFRLNMKIVRNDHKTEK